MTNAEYRREMTGNMPTGSYDMADMQFSVREVPAVEMQPWERVVLELIEWPREDL